MRSSVIERPLKVRRVDGSVSHGGPIDLFHGRTSTS